MVDRSEHHEHDRNDPPTARHDGEERYLRQTFPEYDDYARHVPRMWPRLSPYGSQESAYSSARYLKHREYEAIMGCAVVLAVLVVKLVW